MSNNQTWEKVNTLPAHCWQWAFSHILSSVFPKPMYQTLHGRWMFTFKFSNLTPPSCQPPVGSVFSQSWDQWWTVAKYISLSIWFIFFGNSHLLLHYVSKTNVVLLAPLHFFEGLLATLKRSFEASCFKAWHDCCLFLFYRACLAESSGARAVWDWAVHWCCDDTRQSSVFGHAWLILRKHLLKAPIAIPSIVSVEVFGHV